MSMIKRVIVIGLDSAPLNLIEKWIKNGELPNLGNLMSNGSYGVLNSTFPPLSPAAWSSFSTGMNPGKHGVYDHGYRRSGSYQIVPTNARLRGGKTLWKIIGEKGGRVGVINVPETYPPEPVNGFMISGMDTPSDDSVWSYPESLKQELEFAIGGYQVFGTRSKEDLDLSIHGMQETIPMRFKAAAYLWREYKPDFMILVLMETDVVQHKTWKYMDASHPHHDPKGAKKYGDAILNIYKRIDDLIPNLIENIDDQTAIILMSDHGAGPIDKWLNLNNWLLQEKFLRLNKNLSSRLRYCGYRLGITPNNAYRLASLLPLGIIDRAAERGKSKSSIKQASPLMRAFLSFDDVDWAQTKAYTLGGNMTGIWVNLKGREPQGCVNPGAEYEAVRDEIINRLIYLKDPQNNLTIATKIYRREEIYHGPYLERAPDVVFKTRDEQYVGFGIQEFVSNKIAEPSPIFSGCHRRAGMVVLNGNSFKKGYRLGAKDIVDLAPTILHLLGYPIPEDMDGKVIEEGFKSSYLDDHPIQYSEPAWVPSVDEDTGFTIEEEEAVTEHLRSLGYL